MDIQHFEKDFHYTDRELLTVAKKLGKLATYCRTLKNDGSWIRIETERRPTKKASDEIKVMITVHLPPKKMLRAESRKDNVIEAVDRCAEKLETQIRKHKEKLSGKRK